MPNDISAAPGKFSDMVERGVSLQQQIFQELRAELQDGLWVGRNDFYTETELATRFNVSLITSRGALDRLASEGWIRRMRGKRSTPVKGPCEPESQTGMPVVIGLTKSTFTYELISKEVAVAPAEACRALNRPIGSALWQCLRVRRLDGKVHSVAHNVQIPELAAHRKDSDLLIRSMVSILSDLGEHASVLERRVSAVSPPPDIAKFLEITLGTPILLYTCALHRKDGSVLEWVRIYLHPANRPQSEQFDLDSGAWLTLVTP